MIKHKNSKKQGDAGLGCAIGFFSQEGLTVCLPLTDSQDYDLVVDIEGVLKKVQVKTSRNNRKGSRRGFEVHLKVCGGNRSGTGAEKKFNPTLVDFVFVLCADGSRYLIPSTVITAENAITVGDKKYSEFKL